MLHNKCILCGNVIDGERLKVLFDILNLTPDKFKCIECAKVNDVPKTKGIYTGFSGASPMIFADKVGQQTGVAGIYNLEQIEEFQPDENED